jgi:hypothetical protein
MDQIRFNHVPDGKALAAIAGVTFSRPLDVCICRVKDDVRLGGVIYSNFNSWSVFMHTASWTPHWINRKLIWVSINYPFIQLGVKRIFGMVPGDNVRARKFNEHLGFRYVNSIEGVYKGDVPRLVMRLDREDCRFLTMEPPGGIDG